MAQWLRHILRRSKLIGQNTLFLYPSMFQQQPNDTSTPREISESTDPSPIWCLIGNVIGEHYTKDSKVLYGTKHFSSNTKVFCFPPQWGDGYENIKVIGRHRKSNKNICLVMPSKFITNWRLKMVHHPHVLKIMRREYGWTDSIQDKENILKMLQWLTQR